MTKNKKIIITGATKGIGRAIAEKFASEDYDIALNARTEADLLELKKELETKHPNIEVLVKAMDMRKKAEVLAFAEFIKSHWQEVDILVNNAGLYVGGQVHEEKDGVLEQMIETNLYSAFHLTRAMLPMMLGQVSGHIFNMCSIASLTALPNSGSYTISKFALLGFTKVLRAELLEKGIKVTAVLPGETWSDSWKGADFPGHRLIQTADIAEVIWGASQLSASAVVEEILIRPQLGNL